MRFSSLLIYVVIWMAGSAVAWTAEESGYERIVNMEGQERVRIEHHGEENGGWSLIAEVQYFELVPRLVVRGHYVTRQDLDPTSEMAYRIYSGTGEVIQPEGDRSPWKSRPEGGREAAFEIEIPQVLEHPSLRSVRICLDAVVEYQFWYGKAYPEIPFPEIVIQNLPERDHYRAGWSWIPRYLPAGFAMKIPASFEVVYRDSPHSEFVPALDVNASQQSTVVFWPNKDQLAPEDWVRVPSQRVALAEPLTSGYRGLMPLTAQSPGTVWLRPGMVWESVRWYDSDDWFELQPVTFMGPLIYAAAAWLGVMGLWSSFARVRRLAQRHWRWLATSGWGLAVAWFSADMFVSGFWILTGFYGVIAWCDPKDGEWTPARSYFASWSFFIFVELFWTTWEKSVEVEPQGVWLAAVVWALLLSPLLAIRSSRWRLVLILPASLAWTCITIAGVVYHQFFQDYPSIESLSYAGQVGELGDSVVSLVEQRHLLPLWAWISGALLIAWGRRLNRRASARNGETSR